ncbi:MAG: hypothetical protein ACK5MI_08880 [Mangrovibacterium sp.]
MISIPVAFNTDELNATEATSVPYSLIDMPGYIAKDVMVNSDKITAISGTDGYLVQYNVSDYSLVDNTPVGDGRSLGIDKNGKMY